MPDTNEDVSEEEDTLNLSEPPPAAAPSSGNSAAEALSARPLSNAPADGVAMVERLRSEAEAAEDPTRRAVLLHEAAELEERVAGDELGAAREYLAAFNEDANFREPLEALVRILEKRRSLKNLGRVLDSLSKSAEAADERARALRALSYDAVDVHADRGAAREFLEQAIEADPEDLTAWLLLEIDAGMRSDGEARKRALGRRVELTTDPRWSALLRVDLAEIRAAEGDIDDALDVLTEVISSPGEAAFRACEVAERLARGADRSDREAWALTQRGEIVLESLGHDAPEGETIGPRGQGVPLVLRRAGTAADAFVRAASAYRSVGRIEDEISSLERALAVDPAATMPHLARIAAASRLGDLERAAALARELIERGSRPDLAAHLWLTLAENALAQGDRDGVMQACAKLLEAAGGSENADVPSAAGLVAKTLVADLLLDGSDPKRLCLLLEADAVSRPTEEGKSRGYLDAAIAWALIAGDGAAARTSMAQALTHGAEPRQTSRLGRALAACTPSGEGDERILHDPAWYDEATQRVRATVTDPAEAADVDLDLARHRLSRGDRDGARTALEAVAEGGPRSLLARVLRVALGGDAAGDALLAELGNGAEGDSAVAFAVARALRATRRDESGARTAAIEALAKSSEGDEVAALVKAANLVDENPSDAAEVVRELARASTEPGSRDVLRAASGLLFARSSKIAEALEVTTDLETDAAHALAPMRAIWSRLITRSNEDERRGAVEIMGRDVLSTGGFGALERAAARLVDDGAGGIEELLAELAASGDTALARAALLLQASWPTESVGQAIKDDALGSLERAGDDAARLVARAQLRRSSQQGDVGMGIVAAENWHRFGGGVPAALEMLIGAELSADSDVEVRGRTALAAALPGALGQIVAASASVAAHVAGLPPPPLPTNPDPEAANTVALAAAELAPPGCDPQRRERAVVDLATVLVDSSSTLHELGAWSALARADYATARAHFAKALELAKERGDEPRSAVEGAVETELAAAGGRPSPAWAELVENLARVVDKEGDTETATNLFEQVGHAWWDALQNTERGERALAETFARDAKRKAAFERVFRAIRARKEDDALLEIVRRRLENTDDPPEMAKLFWEQARVLRAKGDRDAALSSLENVTMLEPDHVGALALSAEIYVGRQMYEEAAMALDRLSRQPVPVEQKIGAGLGAADLYEGKLDRPDAAMEVLVALDKVGLSDVAIHERIARAAAKAKAWIPATTYLEKLVAERPTADGRIEAARLAAAIYRDSLDDSTAAVPSLVSLLREAPEDPDALEQLLDIAPLPSSAQLTVARSQALLRAKMPNAPTDVRTARIVGRLAGVLGDHDGRQVSLSVLHAMSAATPEERAQEAQMLGRMAPAPVVALDGTAMKRLAAAEETGPLLELFRLMAPTIAEALGPTTEALGVGRKERVDVRSGSPMRTEVAAWAGALGITEFELYVGGKDPNVIQGVPGDVASVVIGTNIRGPLSLEDRARLVRELLALARGTTIVLQRDDVSVAAVIVASCALVEVKLQTPAYAVLAETQKLISKAISRKTKKALPPLADLVARHLGGGGDLRPFRAHAIKTLDRAAMLATGTPVAALAQIVGPGAVAARIDADPRAQAMLGFAWSDDYFALRKQLGLGIG